MKNILAIIFRRRREALIFAISIVLFPLSISYIMTEKYESTASLLLTAGRFKKPFIPNEKDSQTGFIQVSMEDVASEVELLSSRPVLEKVVEANKLYIFGEPAEDEYLKRFVAAILDGINYAMVAINLKKDMTDFEIAVVKLESKIDVEYLKRTNIIALSWQGRTPELARDVVSSIVEEYIKHHIAIHGTASAFEVIENEMISNASRVRMVEDQINGLKAGFGSYDLDLERSIEIEGYHLAKSTFENLLHVDSNSVTSTSRGLYSDDPNFVGLMRELTNVEMTRIENVSNYGENHKRIAANDKQIANLKALIKSEHLHNLKSWKESRDRYKDRLDKLEMIREEASVLTRSLVGAMDAYQISRQKYNEALISAAMDKAEIASVRVVAPASFGSAPVYPDKILLLIISIFFAIVGGIAAAFAAEKMSSRIVKVGDIIEYAKLKVLISLPAYTDSEIKNTHWLMNNLSKKMAAIRHLLSDKNGQEKVFLVVSPSPKAGTSFVTRQLACYAQRATTAKSLYLSVEYSSADETLVTVAAATKDLVAHVKSEDDTDSLNIALSPDDVSNENSSLSKLLTKLKEAGYGNIFIDLPGEEADASHLNVIPCCDHFFVNVAYNVTDKFALRRFVSVVEEQAGIAPTGAFLNLRGNPIPDFIYRRL